MLMNRRPHFVKILAARIFFAVVAVVWLWPAAGRVQAQDRWLLIFENSSAMKKRMPAVGVELQKLFFTSMGGEMHGGDSLGVWTFDKTLHVGEFPLSTWQPENAAQTSSNLLTFLNKRSFRGEVNFNALQPLLNEVVAGSQRLTVLIFCEGQGDVIWTPYNDAISHSLRAGYAERKKSAQPFVIVLRVQDGEYAGCSVNFPPGPMNFPAFPPSPAELKALAASNHVESVVVEPPKKKVVLDNSPLIIVGKTVVTNLADLPAALADLKTNHPPAVAKPAVTNAPAATNVSVVAEPATQITVTNPVPLSATTSATTSAGGPSAAAPAVDIGYRLLIVIGALALIAALGLGIFLLVQARQPRGSLITDSLNAPRVPPRKR